jgi:hypothetical protein
MSKPKVVLELSAWDLSVLTGCLSWAVESVKEPDIKNAINDLTQRCVEGLRALGREEAETPSQKENPDGQKG